MMFFKIIKFLVRPLVAIFIPTKIIHKEKFVYEKSVVCCNHYHSFDSLVIGTKLLKNGIFCLAKEEIFKTKLIRWLFIKLGAIPVKRGVPDKECFKQSLAVLERGDQLMIFPEGTRNREGTKELAPFKDGISVFALRGRAPVQPMLYYRSPKLFRKNYLIIGDLVHLDDLYDKREKEVRSIATQRIFDAMQALRVEVDGIVEGKRKEDSINQNIAIIENTGTEIEEDLSNTPDSDESAATEAKKEDKD